MEKSLFEEMGGRYKRQGDYLYCAPVEFAVQPDCRPPARYIPGGITVNPGGLQYNTVFDRTRRRRIAHRHMGTAALELSEAVPQGFIHQSSHKRQA